MEGQQSHDRPNLTSRVFRGKLMDLKDQIVHKEIFGNVDNLEKLQHSYM